MTALQMVEIVNPNDDILLPWFDLYETSFPPNERVLISYLLRMLKDTQAKQPRNEHMLAIMEGNGTLAGLVQHQMIPDLAIDFLWYLAIQPDLRNRGYGSWAYGELCSRAKEAGCKTAIFEVEIPERAESADGVRQAERRIDFYHRHGARRLVGIDYMQVIGWHQPPTPMYLMVHPLQPIDPQEAFQIARELFEDSVQQTGVLAFE